MPVVLPMQINVVDVRDVAEAHVKALTEGEDGGRYLVTAGDVSMKEMAKLLISQYPDMNLPSFELPYSLALIAAIFHPKISVSWARNHLKKKIFWDSTPAVNDLGMDWILPPDSILAAADRVIENDWVKTLND
jgi:dihydroflavonol-4-reductase